MEKDLIIAASSYYGTFLADKTDKKSAQRYIDECEKLQKIVDNNIEQVKEIANNWCNFFEGHIIRKYMPQDTSFARERDRYSLYWLKHFASSGTMLDLEGMYTPRKYDLLHDLCFDTASVYGKYYILGDESAGFVRDLARCIYHVEFKELGYPCKNKETELSNLEKSCELLIPKLQEYKFDNLSEKSRLFLLQLAKCDKILDKLKKYVSDEFFHQLTKNFETTCGVRYVLDEKIKYKDRNDLADQIISQIVSCGGLVFGGFVRDRIVRNREWNDLDIWFTTTDLADAFLKQLEKNFSTNSGRSYKFTPRKSNYRFNSMVIELHDSKVSIFMDIVVSETFPVLDFDCNQVSYNGKIVQIHNDNKQALEKIKAGKASMIKGYLRSSRDNEGGLVEYRIYKMIQRGFILDTQDTEKQDIDKFNYFYSKIKGENQNIL